MAKVVKTRWRLFRRSKERKSPRLRLLIWATLAGLIFGAIEFGEPLEDQLRIARNHVRSHPASGEIVVIGIDDKSIDAPGGKWPWSWSRHGKLISELHRLGADRIFIDLDFSANVDPKENREFARALAEAKPKVVLANRFVIDPVSGRRVDYLPRPEFRAHTGQANINFRYNWRGNVWELPYAMELSGGTYAGFAASMARVQGGAGEMFPIDYAIDPGSVPTVSAIDVLERRVDAAALRGKTVVIGTTSLSLGDVYLVPGYYRMSGVYLHAIGAETLRGGAPLRVGWLLPFAVALALVGLSLRARRPRITLPVITGGVLLFLLAPICLDQQRISAQVVPSLFLLLLIGCSIGWRALRNAYRVRGTVNAVTGLSNLNALREQRAAQNAPLIAARIQNYAEITSSLPADEEKVLVEQIAARLLVGAPERKLYQGDEGIFAWFADPAPVGVLGEHLEALHALFRGAVVVGGNKLDLAVTFGLDIGSDRSLTNRLGSALVAAGEASDEGLKWKEYDPEKLKEASWKLSLLSQLDAAIDAEELWVAYQPKVDLVSGKTLGAEALVRWTHAERGPVSPLEFVGAAEQNNRIERLTQYVLDKAVASAAAINARGIEFEISVNLSARLIDDPSLPAMVESILRKHGLAPERLTLEVTETAALNTGGDLKPLLDLRYLGVNMSIDDYGTGLSTLDYLKRIPATEIKIDKSFVQALGKSHSDRLLVHSTIQLAHSLGQKVVAEGVEDRDTLEALRKMGCDIVQGYLLGKPMKFPILARHLLEERKQRAA